MIRGDDADIAAELERREREASIARILSVSIEEADEDEQGNRYCLDCADLIPPARVQAVGAVRCVDCAQARERAGRDKRIAGRGNIRRYLTESANDE